MILAQITFQLANAMQGSFAWSPSEAFVAADLFLTASVGAFAVLVDGEVRSLVFSSLRKSLSTKSKSNNKVSRKDN
jgi:hypothetical protein